MLTTPKGKGGLFLASSLCDGLEDNDIKQVTTLLLNKEADPNVLLPSHGVTPFHLVIGNDSETFAEEVTKLFLRHGGNPNVRSSEGLTPVHVAAAWGRISVLELLLANGGDPLCIDDEGRNPFHYAFDGKYYKAITILGKYCEENFEEDKNFKYTRAFDKLVIKNGDVMAEYVSPEGADIKENEVWNNGEAELSHKPVASSPNEKVSCVSPQIQQNTHNPVALTALKKKPETPLTYNQNLAKLKIEQMMEEEKCLMNKIIDQLSTSLKSKDHKETTIFNSNIKYELNDTLLRTNIDQKTPQKYNYRNKDEILRKNITKQSNRTPKHGSNNGYGRTRDFTGKGPLSPLHYQNDPIISKSPNLIIRSEAYVKKQESLGYLSPRRPEKQGPYGLKTFTPSITRCNDSNRFDQFRYLNKECPRSTPRRKSRFYHHHRTPLRKLNKNIRPSDTLSSSTDSATSLSPDNSYSSKRNKRLIDGRLITKLDEARYDEEDVIEQSQDIGGLNRGFASLNIIEKGQQLQTNNSSDISYQKKLQDTLNSFNSNTKHSSGFSSNESFESLNNYGKDDPYQLVIPAASYSDLNFNKIQLASQVASHFPNNINDDCSSLTSFRSARSFVSVQEDYKYEDADEGVAFLERRLYIVPSCKSLSEGFDPDTTDTSKMDNSGMSGHLPLELQFITNEALRKKLTDLGDSPGPITVTTRNLYLKRLIRLKTQLAKSNLGSQKAKGSPEMTVSVKSSLAYGNWINNLDTYKFLEKNTFQEFANPDPTRRWREGINKTSFNYLLLDPRITKDLPYRAIEHSESEIWNVFISAIFYVGKGKRSRPYAHLYDAFSVYCNPQKETSVNKKIQRILDIWNDGYGVVCLHVFQNTIPVEAYTREAAMIEALGLERLGNKKSGDYYGRAATWNSKEKLSFGRYLLYKAMQILIHEGERQLFPDQL